MADDDALLESAKVIEWLGSEVERLTQERDAARDEIFTLQNSDSLAVVQAEAERNRALTVVRAAEDWCDAARGATRPGPCARTLIAAVDAYREGGETP